MNLRRTAATALGTIMVSAVILTAAPAQAQPWYESSSTNNCYGMYWNTANAQECNGSGATRSGTYKTDVDCSAQSDKTITVDRNVGSKARAYGSHCRHSVTGVHTWYQS